MADVWVVVAAAGHSLRMGGAGAKIWLEVEGKSVLEWTLGRFPSRPRWRGVVTVRAQDRQAAAQLCARMDNIPWQAVAGGNSRADSVRAGMRAIRSAGAQGGDWVLIHDGARPLVSPDLIERVADALDRHEAVVPGVIPHDTVKRVGEDHTVSETLDRDKLRLIQTPQGFHLETIERALDAAADSGPYTDDAAFVERIGAAVWIVPGEDRNRKLTTPADLAWLRVELAREVSDDPNRPRL